MPRIKSVTIRRFKRLQELTLPLGDVTLLIGANNSGKSSILQALHFAVSIAQSARLVGEGVAWARDTFELSFNPAQLIYSPVADVMSLASGGTLQEPRTSRIEIEIVADDGGRCLVGLRRGRNRNIAVSLEGRALGEQLMNIEQPFTVYAPGLAGVPKEERYMSPGVVRRIVARGDANLVLRNVLRMLSHDVAAWDIFIEDMRSIFPGIDIAVEFDENTDENISAYFALPGGPRLPVDAAGTSILQASQLLGYIGLFRPRVLILDEPDSHLHPDNQRALCSLVHRVAAERDFQAVVSTHSRHVLDAMKNRASVAWLSKGRLVDELDMSTTAMLLDLGALDSVDYFADGGLKCVVATEDTDQEPLRALLWSSGFVEDETEVASYSGCSKTDAALVLGRFLQEKAPQLTLVIHRDADYMRKEQIDRFHERLQKAKVAPYLTEHSDIEGYFLNADHLSHLNPGLSAKRAQEIIDEATDATADASVSSIVNMRTDQAFQDRRDTGRNPDHGAIAVQSRKDYEANTAAMRRGKAVVGYVAATIQKELAANARIYQPSPHLQSARLRALASEIWPIAQPAPPNKAFQLTAAGGDSS
jgi:energy-coupling factor transporter ATP-binding protein EcfA2